MSESKVKTRLHFIDMMKGIAIIVIAFYHILLPSTAETFVTRILGPFLIMFFCLSGYFYAPGRRSYKENLIGKLKGLMIPFFKYSLILWVIGTIYHMIANKMSFLDALCCLRNFFGGCIWNRVIQNWFGWDYHHLGSLYMFLADFWFLVALFFAFVLFLAFADWALKSIGRTLITMGVLLITEIILLACKVTLPYNIQNTPYFSLLLLIGAFARKIDLFSFFERKLPKCSDWIFGLLLIIAGVVISFVSNENATNLFRGTFGNNQIVSMLVLTVRSLLVLWGLGTVARRAELSGMRIKEICYIGENSLYVFMFHTAFAYFISVFTGFALTSSYKNSLPSIGNQILSAGLAVLCIALSLGAGRLCNKIDKIKNGMINKQ